MKLSAIAAFLSLVSVGVHSKAADFKILSAGACATTVGFKAIRTVEECTIAAEYLGLPTTPAPWMYSHSQAQTHEPEGCYFSVAKKKLFVNMDPRDVGMGYVPEETFQGKVFVGGKSPICKKDQDLVYDSSASLGSSSSSGSIATSKSLASLHSTDSASSESDLSNSGKSSGVQESGSSGWTPRIWKWVVLFPLCLICIVAAIGGTFAAVMGNSRRRYNKGYEEEYDYDGEWDGPVQYLPTITVVEQANPGFVAGPSFAGAPGSFGGVIPAGGYPTISATSAYPASYSPAAGAMYAPVATTAAPGYAI